MNWGDLADTIFDALVRASWQGGIALLAVWLVSTIVPRVPPAARAWLWRIAMMKMLVALFAFSGVRLAVLPPAGEHPSREAVKFPAAFELLPPIETEALSSPDLEAIPSPTAVVERSEQPTLKKLILWKILTLLAWGTGVLIAAAILVREFLRTRELRRSAFAPEDRVLTGQLVELCRNARLRSTPALVLSHKATVPMLIGLIKPVIILPARRAEFWPLEKLQMILAHELAHLARKDLVWIWLAAFVQTIFFFHPLVWIARREAIFAQESACDELALRFTGSAPSKYAEMLLDAVSQPLQPGLISAAFTQSKSTLKRRITNMKFIYRQRGITLRIATACLLAALGLSLVPVHLVATDARDVQDAPPETVTERSETDARRRKESEERFTDTIADRLIPRAASPAVAGDPEQDRVTMALVEDLRRHTRPELRHILLTVVGDRPLNSLLEDLTEAEQRFAGLSTDFSREHPEIQKVQTVIEKINQQIERRIDGILAGLEMKAAHGLSIRERSASDLARSRGNQAARPRAGAEGASFLFSRTSGLIENVEVKPGDRVNKGQILIKFENPVESARVSTFDKRFKVLESEQRIAEAEFEEVKRQHDIVKRQIEVGRAGSENLPNLEKAVATLSKSQAMIEVARAELVEEQIAESEQFVVRSPVDGIVIDIAEKGQWVESPGRRLGTIQQVSNEGDVRKSTNRNSVELLPAKP